MSYAVKQIFKTLQGEGAQAGRAAVATVAYCLRHPQWRLSLQSHKMIGLR